MSGPSLELRDGVLELRLGDAENRLDAERLDFLEAALERVLADDGVGALVSVGSPRFYSNGYDLDELAALAREQRRSFIARTQALLGRWLELPVPSVAALTGHAFGAGLLLAMAHDSRVMRADRGFVCLPEIDVGIPLRRGMWALLEGRVGYRALRDAALSGRRLTPREALATGFVDELAGEGAVVVRAVELARARAGAHRSARRALAAQLHAQAATLLSRPS